MIADLHSRAVRKFQSKDNAVAKLVCDRPNEPRGRLALTIYSSQNTSRSKSRSSFSGDIAQVLVSARLPG